VDKPEAGRRGGEVVVTLTPPFSYRVPPSQKNFRLFFGEKGA